MSKNRDYDKLVWLAKVKAAEKQTLRNLVRFAKAGRIADIQRGLHRVSPASGY